MGLGLLMVLGLSLMNVGSGEEVGVWAKIGLEETEEGKRTSVIEQDDKDGGEG